MEYILIFVSAIFVNNIILSQFLGICPFLGVSRRIDTSLGMGAAVAFVMTLATIVTWLIQHYVLNVLGLQYLQTLAFILVIASLVQLVEIVLKSVSPALYQALGIFLPLITTNCAVLGVALLVIQKDFTLLESVVYALSTAIGFALALVVFAGLREQLELADVPKGMSGIAIVLITAGLLSLAFMEQWFCWILVNVFSVTIWATTLLHGGADSSAVVMLLKYSFYFINSLNGLRIWLKLSRPEAGQPA